MIPGDACGYVAKSENWDQRSPGLDEVIEPGGLARHRGEHFFPLATQTVQVEPAPYHALVKQVQYTTIYRANFR